MGSSHVIIGDGIAGSSAAEAIRKRDPDAAVTVVTDEGEALYNRILTKEFAKGKLPEAPIHIHDESWYEERDVELRLNTYVVGVDTDAHEVYTHDGEVLGYDTLLVAAGGTPSQLPVENSDAEGVHHFWTFEDARDIREHAERADTGVVIGAGLLGIDLAAICGEHGVDAHYLMRGSCWWRYALSETGAEIVHDGLRAKGVTPVFDSGADRFETEDGRVVATVDSSEERYPSEFVGVAIGLNYNTEFLRDTPVELDDGIVVDEHMRTSVEDVYAAGDITRFPDLILGERTQNGSWGSAREQGTVAGENMASDAGVAGAGAGAGAVADTSAGAGAGAGADAGADAGAGAGADAVAPTSPESEDGTDEAAVFRWVSSYSITHFDFPFLSFGHPTAGDRSIERKYSETEWRRIALRDGRVVGGVLIGDLAPQSPLKKLVRARRDVSGQEEALLAERIDLDRLDVPAQAE